MTSPSPIADLASAPDKSGMRGRITLDDLSRRTPMLVVINLCTALLGYWAEAPLWLPYGLAITSGGLALILMARRDRGARRPTETESADTGWLAHELAGNGSPSGTYLLGFFGVIAIALTGVQGAYALPGWAALLLTAAWAVANARYPADDGSEA